jgi:hypothetical protein
MHAQLPGHLEPSAAALKKKNARRGAESDALLRDGRIQHDFGIKSAGDPSAS